MIAVGAYERLGSALDRLATLPNVFRSRDQDAQMLIDNGVPVDELMGRVVVAAERLEAAASRLEARL